MRRPPRRQTWLPNIRSYTSNRRPPSDLDLDSAANDVPACLLPVLVKPAQKGALDLLSDWPWLKPAHLGQLMGVGRTRLYQILERLKELESMVVTDTEGHRCLVLSDRGLAVLTRRDRTAVGLARQRWSAAPVKPEVPLTWRNVHGSRSRQLLRNLEHTQAVHWFLAVLANQARSQGWQAVQLDPPRRASRFFRHDDRFHSVRPDAFGVLKREGEVKPFFLEWERVRRGGGVRRPEHGDAGRPRRHPVELPFLQARSLPVGPVQRRGRGLTQRR